jgi:hypothetical protein
MKMKRLEIAALLTIGALAGCMAGAPRPEAGGAGSSTSGAAAARASSGSYLGGASGGESVAPPLILDPADQMLGTTVEFGRLPQLVEIQDAAEQFALRHVVVALPAWPRSSEDLSVFAALPPQADVIVILPGYPPDHATIDAWEYARGRIRMMLIVDGPPASGTTLDDLNRMHHLERVIARMSHPSRQGFDQLQRPLAFVQRVD